MKQHISARNLKARLLRVHAASGSVETVHVWFAVLARVNPYTVSRWLRGEREFRGAALALLETLELQTVGVNMLDGSSANGAPKR